MFTQDQDVFVKGSECIVRVGTSAADATAVGYVDSFTGTKNINLQPAQVIGEINPVSLDPMSISVSLSLTGFLACKAVSEGTQIYAGGGHVSLSSFNPNDDDYGKPGVVTKFQYIDFYDKKRKQIITSFRYASSASFSISGNGGAYTKANISMQAIKMSSGKSYSKN